VGGGRVGGGGVQNKRAFDERTSDITAENGQGGQDGTRSGKKNTRKPDDPQSKNTIREDKLRTILP